MRHLHSLRKPDRVYRAVRVSVVRLDELKDTWTETLPRLDRRVNATELSHSEGVTQVVPDRIREAEEVTLGRPGPMPAIASKLAGEMTNLFSLSRTCLRQQYDSILAD